MPVRNASWPSPPSTRVDDRRRRRLLGATLAGARTQRDRRRERVVVLEPNTVRRALVMLGVTVFAKEAAAVSAMLGAIELAAGHAHRHDRVRREICHDLLNGTLAVGADRRVLDRKRDGADL